VLLLEPRRIKKALALKAELEGQSLFLDAMVER
jgi:hypothetical protein